MTKTMHHFMIDADPETGAWDMETINYLGEIDAAEHYARTDTDAVHYDQHDGEVLHERFWRVAGLPRDSRNVALTVVWSR